MQETEGGYGQWDIMHSTGRQIIQPFGYGGVTLDGGRIREQYDEVKAYYMGIPNDDYLKGFRERATGKPAPGKELGGWYSANFGNCFGQVISGLARFYASTGEETIRGKVNALISGWGACIEPDGFCFYSKTKLGPRLYMFDKLVGGLVDAYLYCGNQDALRHLSTITDWAIQNLSREKEYANANADMSRPGGDVSEWYTASENLFRAYLVTGERKYYEAAESWEYSEFWDLFARKADIFGRHDAYHAYSHVNSLSGAATAYLVKGDRHYLDTLVNAYDFLRNTQCFVTGGYGPNEHLTRERVLDTRAHFETQCGSWAAFKLAKHLISFTGDARYGDWVELLAYNGIGASIPMNAHGGVMYYSDYNLDGGVKANTDGGWECCTGTRPQAVADYCDQIYYKDADSLYVALYVPSTIRWNCKGADITLRQRTAFPENPTVDFTVSVSRPTRFPLKVRIPEWLARPMSAQINGTPIHGDANDRHWMAFDREWHDGDHLTLTLPMNLWVSRLELHSEHPAAIMYGPVAMAVSSVENPSGKTDLANLDSALVPTGKPLTWRLASDHSATVKPFYAYKKGERYFLYLDPRRA